MPVEVVAETPAAPEPEPAVEAPVIAEEPAVVEEAPVPIEPVEPEEPKSKHKADDDVVPVRSKGKSKEVDARIPDDPADRKRRRLIVDKRRDVFSIRDYIGISEEARTLSNSRLVSPIAVKGVQPISSDVAGPNKAFNSGTQG